MPQEVWATNLCRRLMFFALNRWQIQNELYHSNQVSKYHSFLQDCDALTIDVTTRYATPQPEPAILKYTGGPYQKHKLNNVIVDDVI